MTKPEQNACLSMFPASPDHCIALWWKTARRTLSLGGMGSKMNGRLAGNSDDGDGPYDPAALRWPSSSALCTIRLNYKSA